MSDLNSASERYQRSGKIWLTAIGAGTAVGLSAVSFLHFVFDIQAGWIGGLIGGLIGSIMARDGVAKEHAHG